MHVSPRKELLKVSFLLLQVILALTVLPGTPARAVLAVLALLLVLDVLVLLLLTWLWLWMVTSPLLVQQSLIILLTLMVVVGMSVV